MSVYQQTFTAIPELPPKKLLPLVTVQRGSTTLTDLYSFSLSRDIDQLTSTCSLSFIGQDQFTYMDPLAESPSAFTVTTGYALDAGNKTSRVFQGYVDNRRQSLRADELLTSGSCSNELRDLISPRTKKILIDVVKTNKTVLENWTLNDDMEDKVGVVSVSDLVDTILTPYGINYTYTAYDYKLSNYRKEDFPLLIIKDLIEFVGGYFRYNPIAGRLEIKDKYVSQNTSYSFLYVDRGDIIELDIEDRKMDFYNCVRVYGTQPDDLPEWQEEEEEGIIWEDDGELYLVDTVEGKERAPSDPYRQEIPNTLIEKKFFNVYLGFEIDPSSIVVEGGSWDSESQTFKDAVLVGYGGMKSSEEVLTTVDGEAPKSQFFLPGEGKVAFPWLYEENEDGDSTGEFKLDDQVYKTMTIKGKVVESISSTPLSGAQASLDFTYEDNIWQHWRHITTNAVVRFYMPADTMQGVLGVEWEDVSSDYPDYSAPTGFPRTAITGSGAETVDDDGKGIFVYPEVPVSHYTVTASAIGYNDGDLEIELDTTTFDFLGGSTEDKNSPYKLIDTPYKVVIWAKRMPPIQFGDYPEDAQQKFNENLAIEVRYSDGIDLANGELLYAPPITDSRVISRSIAIKAGLAVIQESIAQRQVRTLQLPHNPWLVEGDVIAVESYSKGWVGAAKKIFQVRSISTDYSVAGTDEGIWDTVTTVEGI